jgi:membrane-bound serine protease (ClpP class)
MIGERAEVIEPCDPDGRVKAHGEIWAATATPGEELAVGDRVRVLAVEGLRLRVGRDPRGALTSR